MLLKPHELFLVILLSTFFIRCVSNKTNSENTPSNFEQKESVQENTISTQSGLHLKTNNFDIADYHALELDVDTQTSLATGQYFQYEACTKDLLCKKGEFASGAKIIPQLPSGLLFIKIRSCKEVEPSISKVECGAWTQTLFYQQANDSENEKTIGSILQDINQYQNALQDECTKVMDTLKNNQKTDPNLLHSQLTLLRNNSIAQGQHMCAEVYAKTDVFSSLESSVSQSLDTKPGLQPDLSPGGIALLVLGSTAMIARFVAYIYKDSADTVKNYDSVGKKLEMMPGVLPEPPTAPLVEAVSPEFEKPSRVSIVKIANGISIASSVTAFILTVATKAGLDIVHSIHESLSLTNPIPLSPSEKSLLAALGTHQKNLKQIKNQLQDKEALLFYVLRQRGVIK